MKLAPFVLNLIETRVKTLIKERKKKQTQNLLTGEKEIYETRHAKTCLRGLRPGKTQTGLRSHRSLLESWNFGYRNKRYYTIQAANIKGADQTARMGEGGVAGGRNVTGRKVYRSLIQPCYMS